MLSFRTNSTQRALSFYCRICVFLSLSNIRSKISPTKLSRYMYCVSIFYIIKSLFLSASVVASEARRRSTPSLALSLGLFRTFKVSHKGLNVELVYRNFAKQKAELECISEATMYINVFYNMTCWKYTAVRNYIRICQEDGFLAT